MPDAAELVRSIQAGDREAFDVLVRAEAPRLYGIAYRVTGDDFLAEDAVQETFLRLLEGRAPLQAHGAAPVWLARVVARLAIDQVRRREARQRREREHARDRGGEEYPEGQLEAQEEERLVSEALELLPAETRAALWLHVVEGDGIREVAALVGQSRSATARRIRTGLDRMGAFLRSKGWGMVMPLETSLRGLVPPTLPARVLEQLAALPGGVRPAGPSGDGAGGRPGPRVLESPRLPALAGALAAARAAVRKPPVAASLLLAGLVLSLGSLIWFTRSPREPGPAGSRPPETAAVIERPLPALPPDAARPAGDLVPLPPPALVLNGEVLDEEGDPVEGAEVKAHLDIVHGDVHGLLDGWGFVGLVESVVQGSSPLAEGLSGPDGKFSVTLPSPGRLVVLASSAAEPGLRAGATRLVAGPDGRTAVVRLEAAERVQGRTVGDEGEPIAGARLAVIPDPALPKDRDFTSYDFQSLLDGLVPCHAVSDSEGRFDLGPVIFQGRGALCVLAAGPGRVWARTRLPGLPEEEVVIRLLRAQPLPGKAVVMPGERPAAGAWVVAMDGFEADRGWVAAALTDAQGEFALQTPAGREFQVWAKLPGHLSLSTGAWKEEGEPPAPLRVEFGGDGSISGTVRLAGTREPVEDARVLCRGLEGVLLSAECRSDAQGRYRLQGLPLELGYEVLPVVAGFVLRAPLEAPPTAAAPEALFDIELVPTASVRGRVVGAEGKPVPGARVEAVAMVDSDPEGRRLRWRQELLGRRAMASDGEGRFLAEDIPTTGKVFIWAYHAEEGEAFSDPISFPAGGPPEAEVEVRLQRAGLEVRVVDRGGRPLEGVDVDLTSALVWEMLPDGMNLMQWYNGRTSLDISRHAHELSFIPGTRRAELEDGSCRWTDLMAARYSVSISRMLDRGDGSNWSQDYWVLLGTNEEPLAPRQVTTVTVAVDEERKLRGRVRAPPGGTLPPLRIQAFYRAAVPGLKDANGYSVAHTRPDGSFELKALGPGPYVVTAGDVKDRLVGVRNVPEGADLDILYAPRAEAK